MEIIYFTKTKNVQRFVDKIAYKTQNGQGIDYIKDKYILITYTTGYGQVPQETLDFINRNHKMLCGVISSGNKNWGDYFGNAADIISEKFKVPLLMKFELSGNKYDVENFVNIFHEMNGEIWIITNI